MAGFRTWLEQKQGHPVSEVVAASRWLEEVYDPVIAAIPADLRGRLQPAEIFSEVLEHRLVHVGDRGPGRRHHGRHPGLHQARAASGAATTRRGDRRAGEMTLNVSGGFDADPDWAFMREEIFRKGHAYAAASARARGVLGGRPTRLAVSAVSWAAGIGTGQVRLPCPPR